MVAARAKVAVEYVMSLTKGSAAQKNPAFKIASKLVTEALNDFGDSALPEPIMELYFKQLAAMIFWVGSGDKPDDMPWPEDFVI